MGPIFKNLNIFFTVLISFFALMGCSGMRQPVQPVEYYTLEYQIPKEENPIPLPVVLCVENFQISPEYQTNSIIYREDPLKRNHYAYHKWRANPGNLVTYFITRDLNESLLFSSVVSMKSRLIPTHSVEGIVDDFFEKDEKDSWFAVMTVRMVLLQNNDYDKASRVLFQKQYTHTEQCLKKNPQSLAEAMSRNMAAISKQITDDIYSHLLEIQNSK